MQRALLTMSTLSMLALVALVTFAVIPRAPRATWDYKIAAPSDITFDLEMDELGKAGWEVVTCRRAMGSGSGAAYECIFKRPQ